MNKTLTIALVVIILAAGIWFVFIRPAQNPASPEASPSATTNQTSAQAAIEIRNFAFSPAQLTVKQGTRITWTNYDQVAHQVKSDSGFSELDSQPILPGQSFSVVFDQTGTYDYHCAIHPSMIGQIVVQ